MNSSSLRILESWRLAKTRIHNRDLWAPALLVLLGIAFFSDPLFSSKNFYFRDILNFHYPLRKIVIDSFAHGEFPLWNPFIYLGQPMLANQNYMAFYPTTLLHLFLPFNYAFKLHFILHPILAGLGLYFLQRRLGFGCAPALAGSLIYEFSGTVLSFLNLFNIVPAVALLPWIGWAFLGALQRKSFGRAFLFGVLLALQVIALEPLIFQCILLVLAGLALNFLLESKDRRRDAAAVLRTGITGALFAAGLAAVQIAPTLELLPRSGRGAGFNFADVSGWSMHPMDLLNAIVPNLYGYFYTLGFATSWGESIHHGREGYLVSFFLGTSALMLCSLSFFAVRRNLRRILIFLSAAGVVMALGRYNPMYHWMLQHIPFLGLGRYPSKYFLLATFAISIMAALGLEAVFESRKREARFRRRFLIPGACGLVIAIAILCCSAYWHIHPIKLESLLRMEVAPELAAAKDFGEIVLQLSRSILSSGVFLLIFSALVLVSGIAKPSSLFAGLFLLLPVAELIPANLRLIPFISDTDMDFVPEVNSFIARNGPKEPFRVFPPSGTLRHPLSDLQIRAPNRSAAWLTLFFRQSGQPFYGIMNGIQYSLETPVDHLNTKETEEIWKICTQLPESSVFALLEKLNSPLILSFDELRDPRLRLLSSFDTRSKFPIHAYWLENALGRTYFASGVAYVKSPGDALAGLLNPDFQAGNQVILQGQGESRIGETGAGSARIIDYRNSRVECEVIARTHGYLVLLDSYYPGWIAYVDGKKTGVLRANYAFRAVKVTAGRHRIEFTYRPVSFYIGLALTSVFLLGGLVAVIGKKRIWRKDERG